ncbi:MAG: ABC transporter [Desulfobulbus propionicus]|nr:MAG: ABC transporter [Desulfobulbus propionicus]
MSDSSIIYVDNISLRYKIRNGFFRWFEHTPFSHVTFDVKRGETLGVIGSNGCGKSTLLRLLAGIVKPTSGKIVCDKKIKRSLLTLGLGFRPDLSGRENAVLGMMLQGVNRAEAIEMADDVCNFTELGDFFEQPVKTYSVGMRARLGFATSIKSNVDVLLVDEVLSVGDANFKKKAEKALLEKINSDLTVIFVSHDIGQIKKICNRTVWLHDGAVKIIDETEHVAEHYSAYIKDKGEKIFTNELTEEYIKKVDGIIKNLEFKGKSCEIIDTLRDTAVYFEKRNLKKSYVLMAIAAKIRPNGPFIKKRIDYYKSIIE